MIAVTQVFCLGRILFTGIICPCLKAKIISTKSHEKIKIKIKVEIDFPELQQIIKVILASSLDKNFDCRG